MKAFSYNPVSQINEQPNLHGNMLRQTHVLRKYQEIWIKLAVNSPCFRYHMDAWKATNVEMSSTGTLCSVLVLLFGWRAQEELFSPTFGDLEPFQSQNNCGVFCFLLYKAGSLEEMV